MENLSQIKVSLLNTLMEMLDSKIVTLKQDIASIKDSRDSDTKSSVGDKYESSRVLIQMELDKAEAQLDKTLFLKKELSHIDLQKQFTRVEVGSLVITSQGNYFISAALSKIELNNEIFQPISMGSPIGQALQNKKVNDTIQFQGNDIKIVNII